MTGTDLWVIGTTQRPSLVGLGIRARQCFRWPQHVALGIYNHEARVIAGEVCGCNVRWNIPANSWWYFESRCTRNRHPEFGRTDKDGVRGPMPVSKLDKWIQGCPRWQMRSAQWKPLPHRPDMAEQAILYALWAVDHVSYAPLGQLAANALGIHSESILRQHCSEFVVRAIVRSDPHFWSYVFPGLNAIIYADDVLPVHLWDAPDTAARIIRSSLETDGGA